VHGRAAHCRCGVIAPMHAVMSTRSERDRLLHELDAARKRIADLETALLRRGRDTLTAVLRIEAFREQLVEELQRTRRRGLQGALIVLQVDRLADVHRDHGFAVGDAILSALVESLRAGTRGEDLLGRIGDDSFALLLREAGETATSACIARLLGDLQLIEAGPVRGVSASAGIALFGPQDDDAVTLFERAGRALGDAQAGGGGRAVIADRDGDSGGTGVSAALHRRDAVEALAVALLERDRYTGEHSESVVEMAVAVAGSLGLSQSQVEDVRAASLLHDIGKVGIPDAILNKPGPLTPDERTVMAEHPVIGERILRSIGGFLNVAEIVRHEHESWDGSGYPDGLAGADIPIGSRVILACDAYHAMTSDRPYRARMSHADAFAELTRCAGRQFDPDVTAALVAHFYHARAGRSLHVV
ncbi:MAG: bifunctional diguanylate cyclase/phosphohydrolase, partial [Solirubrobacteraceae bacterium]